MYLNWYNLLKNIPDKKMYDEQIKEFRKEIFRDLKSCKICGKIAIKNHECLSCGLEEYNDSLKEEFPDEKKYIKEEQLEMFATHNKKDVVRFVDNSNGYDGFERKVNNKFLSFNSKKYQ